MAPSTTPPVAPPPAGGAPPPTRKRIRILSRIYNTVINAADKHVPGKFRPFWEHPAGPKTVFFWGPLIKWGLVIAGLADLARPAEVLSVQQSAALATTGFIWSRYSLVIYPKNFSLFSVNFFVGITQLVQLARALVYQLEQNNSGSAKD